MLVQVVPSVFDLMYTYRDALATAGEGAGGPALRLPARRGPRAGERERGAHAGDLPPGRARPARGVGVGAAPDDPGGGGGPRRSGRRRSASPTRSGCGSSTTSRPPTTTAAARRSAPALAGPPLPGPHGLVRAADRRCGAEEVGAAYPRAWPTSTSRRSRTCESAGRGPKTARRRPMWKEVLDDVVRKTLEGFAEELADFGPALLAMLDHPRDGRPASTALRGGARLVAAAAGLRPLRGARRGCLTRSAKFGFTGPASGAVAALAGLGRARVLRAARARRPGSAVRPAAGVAGASPTCRRC